MFKIPLRLSFRLNLLFGLTILALLVAGCGPSQPAVPPTPAAPAATSTPAPTNTPVPTPTPTPIPYDLTAQVTDAEGKPIAGAVLQVTELGTAKGAVQTTDAAGKASWTGLPKETITLDATAQGYLPGKATQTIKRGANQVSITLKRDPFGLLAADACAPGEKPLYIKDFQDGKAQGWPEIELGAPGWKLEADPDAAGNMVISARKGAPWVFYDRQNVAYDNVVWRIQYKYTGKAFTHLSFRFIESPEMNARYMYVGGIFSQLQRIQQQTPVGLGNFSPVTAKVWHRLEMGYMDGVLNVWFDGKKLLEYKDPQPWKGGTINLEPYPQDEASVVYYDNISVCELSAPFKPMPTPTPKK